MNRLLTRVVDAVKGPESELFAAHAAMDVLRDECAALRTRAEQAERAVEHAEHRLQLEAIRSRHTEKAVRDLIERIGQLEARNKETSASSRTAQDSAEQLTETAR